MSIGPDLIEAFEDLGDLVTITNISGDSVQEYLVQDDNFSSASTELQRQFSMSALLKYNTQAVVGDIVGFANITDHYLIASLKPVRFEGDSVINNMYMWKCNCYGKFQNKNTVRNSDMMPTIVWTDKLINVYGMQFERNTNTEAIVEEDVFQHPVGVDVLFVPAYSTISVTDRWFPDQTDETVYYKVDAIQIGRFEGIKLCFLTEDNRE